MVKLDTLSWDAGWEEPPLLPLSLSSPLSPLPPLILSSPASLRFSPDDADEAPSEAGALLASTGISGGDLASMSFSLEQAASAMISATTAVKAATIVKALSIVKTSVGL